MDNERCLILIFKQKYILFKWKNLQQNQLPVSTLYNKRYSPVLFDIINNEGERTCKMEDIERLSF